MGVACSFANAVLKYRAGHDAMTVCAKAPSRLRDALTRYKASFKRQGMDNDEDEIDTLRHTFVLVLGLGMRESSGQYSEGRDMSASNVSGGTCEAGAWQTSYNLKGLAPLIDDLLDEYDPPSVPGFVHVYRQGVSQPISKSYGSGRGLTFQRLSKNSPDFACEVAAYGIRIAYHHWGPLIQQKAQVVRAADEMLQEVQKLLDTPSTEEVPSA